MNPRRMESTTRMRVVQWDRRAPPSFSNCNASRTLSTEKPRTGRGLAVRHATAWNGIRAGGTDRRRTASERARSSRRSTSVFSRSGRRRPHPLPGARIPRSVLPPPRHRVDRVRRSLLTNLRRRTRRGAERQCPDRQCADRHCLNRQRAEDPQCPDRQCAD